MAEETITAQEARTRLLLAFGKSTDGSFLECLERPLMNPVEQRDEKGRRRVHTLVIVGLVLAAIAVLSAVVFSVHWGHWG